MTRANKSTAIFTIYGFADRPDDLTLRLGVQPSHSWSKGDLNPANQLERTESRWSLSSRLPGDAEIESHAIDVLNQLDQSKEIFKEVVRKADSAFLQLVAYYFSYYPGLTLSADTIGRIAEYNLSMDFDFYYLCSQNEETEGTPNQAL